MEGRNKLTLVEIQKILSMPALVLDWINSDKLKVIVKNLEGHTLNIRTFEYFGEEKNKREFEQRTIDFILSEFI